MYRSKAFRMTALAASLVMAFSLTAVDTAEARRGGSFGSRGMRTERVIPQTQTSPKTTAPVQRTDTSPTSSSMAANAARPRPSLFGGFAGAMLGGLLFSGLFGMLFGYGFGGGAGLLALLVQIGLVAAVVWFFTRRRRAAAAGPGMGAMNYEASAGGGYAGGSAANNAARSNASRRAGRRDEIGITDADLADFERGLVTLQAAYAAEDMATLRRIATPEVVRVLTEELEDNRVRGVRNEVFDVQLLSGDIAESWREDNWEYATLALRYESRDILRDRNSGEIVGGDDSVTETTEVWTFRRQMGAPWIVSAIQNA
jgi:predicted lipid-binding transport protein (Tim44 family)